MRPQLRRVLAPIIAVPVVIAVGVVAVAIGRGHAASPRHPGAVPAPVTVAPRRAVTARIELTSAHTTVGVPITGAVVITNGSGHPIPLVEPHPSCGARPCPQRPPGPAGATIVVPSCLVAVNGATGRTCATVPTFLPTGVTRASFSLQSTFPCPTAFDCPASRALKPGVYRIWLTFARPILTERPESIPVVIVAPTPCPVILTAPIIEPGRRCMPDAPAGNGFGPGGECTGAEHAPPCGAGMVAGKYYAYTLPGRCDVAVIFDGRRWDSELPPPRPVPDLHVWISVQGSGSAGFVSNAGSVGFRPQTGRPTACRG